MNKIKFLMALIAVCILIAPALSMPYRGSYPGEWQNDQHSNKAANIMKGPEDGQRTGGCQKSDMGPNDKQMDHKFVKSMMGPNDEQMMGGCRNAENCECQKSCMGPNDKQMDHKFVKSMMGPNDEQMMGGMGSNDKQMDHKFVKSMMGDKIQKPNKSIEEVTVAVLVVK
ncbi:MAG: hypothetical protein MUO26_12440 [Methanotrichaceae archaeon]|nr:hypothetical protein [Methanotrichaceae archaeon]